MEKTKLPKFFVTRERGNWSVNTFDDERGPVRLVSIYSRKTTALREAKRRNVLVDRAASKCAEYPLKAIESPIWPGIRSEIRQHGAAFCVKTFSAAYPDLAKTVEFNTIIEAEAHARVVLGIA